MSNRIYTGLIFSLAFAAVPSSGVTITTTAFSDASMCCLPNGGEITAVVTRIGAFALNPSGPEWHDARVSYRFIANNSCSFAGQNIVNRTGVFTITSQGNFVDLNSHRVGERCPFGVRARSDARTRGGPVVIIRSALSECAQPCHDCDNFPFEE